VLAEDVLAAAAPKDPAPKAAAPAVAPPTRSSEDKVVEITDMVGKGMIKSMNAAMQQPFMALGEEIDVTVIFALQKVLKEAALKKYGVKVTLTSFIIKAISLSLSEFPIINSKFGPADANPPTYKKFGSHNITVAIDSPSGLVVPNIKDCGNLSIIEIQQELNRLVVDAKAGKLSVKDLTGGTITFSNVGSIGTKDPRPILYDGQAVIGAAGRLMTLPRYDAKGQIVPRQVMNVRWVGDHRHLDGATLARFSNAFKRYMEDPGEWTLTLR
jgi:2-oxoisovalerate dehydrogenase E2 component (dihydrolipoyl transacylase)